MNHLKDIAKYGAGLLIRGFWNTAGSFMPSDKKKIILFDSFVGKQYSCNPRAIYEFLYQNCQSRQDILYVWALKEPEKFSFLEKNKNTVIVKYHSFAHHRYFYQANVIVFNWKTTYDLPVRKGQMLLQTWHGGGCYKKAGTEFRKILNFMRKLCRKRIALLRIIFPVVSIFQNMSFENSRNIMEKF